jgi:hypothetical protein
MKKLLLLTSTGVIFLSISAFAQVNTDSLAIVAKISKYELQMGKLQNTVQKKTNDKQNDSLLAQQSATANSTAANTLSANPQDKADAREADHTAGNAKSEARKARKAADKLDDVNKNILDLQYKIAAEQVKLSMFTHVVYVPAPMIVMTPVPADSTHH